MRRSNFKRPKTVLVFNGAQVLVAVIRSLLQAISFCCTGKYVCSGGLYFRHLHPDVEVGLDDLDNLQLQEYDALCGEKRTYYSVRQMARKRVSRQKKNDNDEKER